LVKVRRILERSELGEGTLDNRKARATAIILRAERYANAHDGSLRNKRTEEARVFKKRAHQEARLGARLIGVLEIEFGIPMAPEIERLREVFRKISPGPITQ
jgi:hypothetical protein